MKCFENLSDYSYKYLKWYKRTEYGKKFMNTLSKALTKDFGKGFSISSLKNMRLFYKINEPSMSENIFFAREGDIWDLEKRILTVAQITIPL